VVRMVVTASVRPEKRVEFLQVIDSLNRSAGKSSHCGSFTISQDAQESDLFEIALEWGKDQDFERCLASEEFRVFLGAVRVLCKETKFSSTAQSDKWVRILPQQWERIPGNQRESFRIQSPGDKPGTPKKIEGK